MKTACILIHFFIVISFNLSAQWQVVGSPRFTPGAANSPDIVISNSGTPYVAFKDATLSNKATVMKYNGINWVMVGSPGFSMGTANNLHLAIDKYDSLYVGYSNASDSNLYVMKFNGSTWNQLGALNFKSPFCNIAVDTNDTPYVVSITSAGNLFVKSYNTGMWTGTGFTAFGIADENPFISIDKTGTPYVVYHFHTLPDPGMELRKYTGGSWVSVIASIFNSPTSLKINEAGQTFTAFSDNVHGYQGVMKGTTVTYTNTHVPNFVDMDIDSSSTPCLLYPLPNNMTITPAINGLPSSVAPFYNNYNSNEKIAFDKSNTPSRNRVYVAYNDTGNSKLTVIAINDLLSVEKNKIHDEFISVFPNPARDQFFINTSIKDKLTIDLFDINGRHMLSKTIINKTNIDISDLNEGVYTVVIKTYSGAANRKLVLIR